MDEENETERSLEIKKNKIKSFTNCLIDLDINFKIEDWESGIGTNVIINTKDSGEKDFDKEYFVRMCFYDSGYVNFEVDELLELKND